MNKILVLINNVILIGNVTESNDEVTIDKPYSIKLTSDGYQLQPFLKDFTGQDWPSMTFLREHILTSNKAEQNDILVQYLSTISGIELPNDKIIT